MDKIGVGISSDYAILDCNSGEFYYGYEKEQDNEWCFSALVDGFETLIQFSQLKKLGAKDEYNCTENLLIGIGYYLDNLTNK